MSLRTNPQLPARLSPPSVESAVGAPSRESVWGQFFWEACGVLRVSLCRVILRPSSTHTRLAHMSILSVIVTIVSAITPITGGTDGVIVVGASGTEATPFIPHREYYVDDIAPRHMAGLRAVPAHARPEEWLPLRLTPSSYAAAHYRQRFVGRRKAIKRSGPHEEYG